MRGRIESHDSIVRLQPEIQTTGERRGRYAHHLSLRLTYQRLQGGNRLTTGNLETAQTLLLRVAARALEPAPGTHRDQSAQHPRERQNAKNQTRQVMPPVPAAIR